MNDRATEANNEREREKIMDDDMNCHTLLTPRWHSLSQKEAKDPIYKNTMWVEKVSRILFANQTPPLCYSPKHVHSLIEKSTNFAC